MRWKRYLPAALCLLCAGAITLPAFANSAPSYWKAYPASEMLSLEEDSPIEVEQERLRFDFSERREHGSTYSPTALVEAAYEMKNPADRPLSVQMAFPFVGSLSSLSLSEITIEADGKPIPFELYLNPDAASVDSDGSFSFDGFGNTSKDELSFPGGHWNTEANLFRFRVQAPNGERVKFTAYFDAAPEQTIVIGKGFSGSNYSDSEGTSLSTWIDGSSEMELLVLGDVPEVTYCVFSEDGTALPASSFSCDIVQNPVNPKDYVLNAFRSYLGAESAAAIPDTQLLNLCLQRVFSTCLVTGYTALDMIFETAHYDRVITLVYTVDFPPGAVRNLIVSYPAAGSMDRTKTTSPLYRFIYLLSPAKNWSNFASLEIEIIPPAQAPYLIESSLPFTRTPDNRYTAQLDSLPDDELTFTLYENERVTFLDRVQKTLSSFHYTLYFLWPVLLFSLVVLCVGFAVRAGAKRKHSE